MILLNCRHFVEAKARGDLEDAAWPTRLSGWLHVRICPPCAMFVRQLRLISSALRHGLERRMAGADMERFQHKLVERLASDRR
ncbi:MAG: hypothetical protein ABIJ96_18705 [Elusimicrobiota bacterium]